MTTVPRFPVYIPSKGRATIATTPKVLDRIGVPWRMIVEQEQFEDYAAVWGEERLLILDPAYQRDYDPCDDLGDSMGKGSGPARNFAWEHSMDAGAGWHWIIDDNLWFFARLHQNRRIPVGDGQILHAMEEFVLRYVNVGLAGPQYWMFLPSREKHPPFGLNRRIFSCVLIRNDLGLRWRGRYNEDLLLSIAALRAGWCTILFNAFLQGKMPTGTMPGGNQDELYREGTLRKSLLAVREHPDIIRLVHRYGRAHHEADFSEFADLHLIRRDDYLPPAENPYASKVVDCPSWHGPYALQEPAHWRTGA